jgi:hypothetical protein
LNALEWCVSSDLAAVCAAADDYDSDDDDADAAAATAAEVRAAVVHCY